MSTALTWSFKVSRSMRKSDLNSMSRKVCSNIKAAHEAIGQYIMSNKSDPEKSPFDKSEIMALGHKIQAIQKQAAGGNEEKEKKCHLFLM